jgi:hypothetical protein
MSVQEGMDSAGRPIIIGSKVRFRGRVYTVKAFHPGKGRGRSQGLSFEEPVHTTESPDEFAVDLVE